MTTLLTWAVILPAVLAVLLAALPVVLGAVVLLITLAGWRCRQCGFWNQSAGGDHCHVCGAFRARGQSRA